MAARIYLTIAEVLTIHADLIWRYGGSSGLRDLNQLESALSRPRSGYYEDVIEEAAALWESLSQNHPFIDGNKRVAFAVAYTFLQLNKMELIASADSSWAWLNTRYDSGSMTFNEIERWLRDNTKSSDE